MTYKIKSLWVERTEKDECLELWFSARVWLAKAINILNISHSMFG